MSCRSVFPHDLPSHIYQSKLSRDELWYKVVHFDVTTVLLGSGRCIKEIFRYPLTRAPICNGSVTLCFARFLFFSIRTCPNKYTQTHTRTHTLSLSLSLRDTKTNTSTSTYTRSLTSWPFIHTKTLSSDHQRGGEREREREPKNLKAL